MIYLDDGFFAHPKVIAAGDEATTLYLRGLAWLKQQGSTDGRIPKIVLPLIAPNAKGRPLTGRTLNGLADRLVQVVMWHDNDNHWTVHGYIERNEKAIAKSEQARDAARKRHANAVRTHDRPKPGTGPTADGSPTSRSSRTPANTISDAKQDRTPGRPIQGDKKGSATDAESEGGKPANPQVSDGEPLCGCNADADADAADPQMRPQCGLCGHSPQPQRQPTETATSTSSSSSSNGSSTPADQVAEEEDPRISTTNQACRLLADRALDQRTGSPVTDRRAWLTRVTTERRLDHADRAHQLLDAEPDLTPAELADLLEPDPTNLEDRAHLASLEPTDDEIRRRTARADAEASLATPQGQAAQAQAAATLQALKRRR